MMSIVIIVMWLFFSSGGRLDLTVSLRRGKPAD
jgi:hypothetical protein